MGKLFNRARMTVSGTPGTGTITLLAATTGFQSFASAGVASSDVVSYLIEDGTSWEYGQGTYTSSGTTLARTTIQGSSAGGTTAISTTSNAIVSVTALAADIPDALAWTAFTSTITASVPGATPPTATGPMRYKQFGKKISFTLQISITNNGTGAGAILFTIPVAVANTGVSVPIYGRQLTGGSAISGQLTANTTSGAVVTYNGAYPGSTGETLVINSEYESA